MKSSTPIIILVVFLAIVLVTILIVGFVVLPTKKTQPSTGTNGGTGSTGTNGGTGSNSGAPQIVDIPSLVTQFRDSFNTIFLTNRCEIITKVNNLSLTDLRIFEVQYLAAYSLTVKQEMDAAWRWCGIDSGANDPGQELYDKLS